MDKPLVSVVLPVYNAEQYIEEALLSVINQTWTNLEVIVIDDGSTDNTASLISAVMKIDQRVKLVQLQRGGIVTALNQGVARAKGEYIARMDADDICHPERFAKQISFLAKNNLDLCGCNVETFGASKGIKTYPLSHDEIVTNLCTYGKSIAHPTVMAKARVFKAFPYSSCYPNAEDYALWLDIALNSEFKLGNCQGLLLKYRVHANQVSKEKKSSQVESTANALIDYLGSTVAGFTSKELIANTQIARQRISVSESTYQLHLSFMEKLKELLLLKNIDLTFFDHAVMRISKRSAAYKNFPSSRYILLMNNRPVFFKQMSLALKTRLAAW